MSAIVSIPADHFGLYRHLLRLSEQLVAGVESGTADVTVLEQIADQVDRIAATTTCDAIQEISA